MRCRRGTYVEGWLEERVHVHGFVVGWIKQQ
jgi:hypothetical protein